MSSFRDCDFSAIFNFFLSFSSPSTTQDKLSKHSDNEYFRAEQIGKSGQPCHQVFRECTSSLLDIFTGVHNPIEEFTKMMI